MCSYRFGCDPPLPILKAQKRFIRTFWAESSMGLLEDISLTRESLCPVFTYLQLQSLGKLLSFGLLSNTEVL